MIFGVGSELSSSEANATDESQRIHPHYRAY
jgi:hypothetical protein